MEKLTHETLVRKNHKLGGNDYVLDSISGIIKTLGGVEQYASKNDSKGKVFTNSYTQERYEKTADVIEAIYPGLCEFDYQLKRS